jgi:putative flippase GtrA
VKSVGQRWLQFSAVGVMGAAVQLVTLHVLTAASGIAPLAATAAAVELTLVHNFLWHEQLTWRDRPCSGFRDRMGRLLAFHLANGGISLVGNLAITATLLHFAGFPVIAANFFAICVCSVANFFLGDRWVFQSTGSVER